MPKVKIATAQSLVTESVEQNGIEIRKLIRKGKNEGANLIHFCELALSGYNKNQVGSQGHLFFQAIRSELEKIKALCKQLNIWTVIGSAHELSDGVFPHNSLYIISNKGQIVNRYDKRKCSHNELLNWYTPGFQFCHFEIQGIKFGCVIYIEIQFPELFIEANEHNIQCMLFSSYLKDIMFGIQAQGYAASNNYWISMSIPKNESKNLSSRIIGPNGEIIAECRKTSSTIVTHEIDTEDVKWHVPLKLAKPWRKLAREGKVYENKRVIDERSESKNIY